MPLYKQDPNDSTKQVPNISGSNRYDRTTNPDRVTFTKTPNYVLVNKTMTKPFGFFYGSSGDFSALADSNASSNYDLVVSAVSSSWQEGYGIDMDFYSDLTNDKSG